MTVVLVTLPVFRLLYPVTNEENREFVETSRKYVVAPTTAVQFAVKVVPVTFVAAVAVGAPGAMQLQ